MTFEEEYLALLKKHKIDFDPGFVFDQVCRPCRGSLPFPVIAPPLTRWGALQLAVATGIGEVHRV